MTTFKRDDPFPFEFEVQDITDSPLGRALSGAALFDGKRLVLVSDCPVHPKYQALRPPRSKKADCVCAEIYSRRNAFDAGR